MRRFFSMILLAAMAWLVAGCSVSGDEYDKRLQAALPKEELAQAEQVLALLNSKDFDAIKKQMDPRFIGANFDQDIQRVGAMLPDEKPILTKTIGSRTNTFNGTLSQYTLSFEQQFSKSWLLTAVQLQKENGKTQVIGINVEPKTQSLATEHVFTFEGKGALHYLVFALAVLIPLFIVLTLVLCLLTPIAKRKWLWMLFIAVGITNFVFNWSNGAHSFQLLYASILGAGFMKNGPYAPCIISLGFPLGAIIFLLRRRALMAKAASATNPTIATIATAAEPVKPVDSVDGPAAVQVDPPNAAR